MSIEPLEYMPPVECAPWCDYGDGHPGETCRGDQTCWSIVEYVDLSLEATAADSDGDSQQIGAMAYRDADEAPGVYLHLSGIKIHGPIPWPHNFLDRGLRMTVHEAEALSRTLAEAAKLARSTPPPEG
ncbi:hypothetical protein [Mycolicibacterium poriferae]|uniref:hypothetical protein n=1 Tax=Mycolicibacterium poriferae TaxID=39694 RepID=UPI0024B8D3EE|nr:hypothetical protein [Mycolicibacterium poriferae]